MQVGPECHHKCPNKRNRRGDTDIQRRRRVKTEAQNGVM